MRAFVFNATTAIAALGVLALPRAACADDVSATGKGAVGGALVGSEIVVFGEALFGVRSTPAYILGAVGGAAAGGVAGYFVEQGASSGRVPSYLLAGGLALVIPAIVIALNETRYVPSQAASSGARAAGGGGVKIPPSLFNVRDSEFVVGLPVPEVRPLFTAATAAQSNAFAVRNSGSPGNEVNFPIVALQF